MIRRKMEQGYTFWIVKKDPLREVRLTNVDSELADNRHIIMHDADAKRLLSDGRIALADDRRDSMATDRRARTAEEVVSSDTVAHRPHRGG